MVGKILVASLWLASSATALAQRQECVLESPSLRYGVTVDGVAVQGRTLLNRLTGKTFTPPTEEFRLEFLGGTVVRSSQCPVSLSCGKGNTELLFSCGVGPAAGLEVRVRYTLPPGKAYLRKQIAVRQREGKPLRLMVADLENWSGVKRDWDSMHADRCFFGSHPIFCEDVWAGVEFVAAFNQYSRDGLVLRSRPGGPWLSDQWLELHSTVVGVAREKQVRAAFLEYIEDIRLAPPRMVCCYNPWWTLPSRFNEQELLALARDLKRQLFDKHGLFFDVVAPDAGWARLQSIWEIDPGELPQGFARVREIVESAGGRLGLWMSPSSIYPISVDHNWARRNGFTLVNQRMFWGSTLTGISLADPKYRLKTKEELRRLIRENQFAHIKFDGLLCSEEVAHHDLLPGDDSVEPLAAHALELIAAAKEAHPNLVAEPTFLNSWANYISPWIVKYADTVFGNSGGDYPRAMGPAPDYREACTNAREWYIFSSLDEVWLPQNVLQYFDIIHCDAAAGLPNHLAMAIGRGRFFLPAYVNPKYVSEDEWTLFAGLLRWARSQQAVLRNTIVLPSRVELGEPYCYAHWLGKRGILAIRNPSNETKVYRLDLRAAAAPGDLVDGVCYTQYPFRKGLAAGVDHATVIPVRLAPWELLFVEIVPRTELREPVAIGARWYRDAQGRMRIAANSGVAQVQVLQPGAAAITCDVTAAVATEPVGSVRSTAVTPIPKEQWLQVRGKPRSTVRFDVDCSVSPGTGCTAGKVLLLLEFPGREHAASTCTAKVNGRNTALEMLCSAGHIGYAGGTHGFNPKSYWASLIPYESEWTWYICPLGAGESRVHFSGTAAMPQVRIKSWVWSDRDCAAHEKTLPIVCPAPAMPQRGERIERCGVRIMQPVVPGQ